MVVQRKRLRRPALVGHSTAPHLTALAFVSLVSISSIWMHAPTSVLFFYVFPGCSEYHTNPCKLPTVLCQHRKKDTPPHVWPFSGPFARIPSQDAQTLSDDSGGASDTSDSGAVEEVKVTLNPPEEHPPSQQTNPSQTSESSTQEKDETDLKLEF